MIKLHYTITFLLLTVISPAALAGEITSVSPITIGSIDLHPAGDTIIIDAKNAPAIPTSSRSLITGGGSGEIVVKSTNVEQMDVTYPLSVTLSDGDHQLTITDIQTYSEYSDGLVNLPGGGISVSISVGGKIILPKTTVHGNYSGSMLIQLNFL